MREKKKTIDKKSANSKLKEIAQKQKLQEKGITLIALVVTIIILLILAGVTLNIALSDNGLFNKAKKAADDYKEAQDRELEEIENFGYKMEEATAGISERSYNEEKGVNEPQITGTGLIPVSLDNIKTAKIASTEPVKISSEETEVKGLTEKEIQAENWYEYKTTNKKWANAKTAEGSLWVWIPRFAYNIKYKTTNKSEGGTIDIVFLKGTTDEPAPTTSEGKDSKEITIKRAKDVLSEGIDWTKEENKDVYLVHPAFTNESSIGYANGGWDKEISGFWMAKFEAGYVGVHDNSSEENAKNSPLKYSSIYGWSIGDNKAEDITNYYYGSRSTDTFIKWPTFQANRPSMNYMTISDSFELCKAMNKNNNPYGLNSSKVDSHLVKNSEWGAVAYLSYSNYGSGNNAEIITNTSNAELSNIIYTVTGYADNTSGNNANFSDLINGTVSGNWKTTEGQKASTTGNIYGIYDMSGGSHEWTSGYVATGTSYNNYGENLKGDTSDKYKNKYTSDDTNSEDSNYKNELNNKRLGEAIWETSTSGNILPQENDCTSWNKDYSWFINGSRSFFTRGGTYADNWSIERSRNICILQQCWLGCR